MLFLDVYSGSAQKHLYNYLFHTLDPDPDTVQLF